MFTSVNLNQREGENVSALVISREVKQDCSSLCLAKGSQEGLENNSLCSKIILAREKYQDKLVPNTARLKNEEEVWRSFERKNKRDRGVCWVFWNSRELELPTLCSNIPLSKTNVIIQGFN